MWNNANQAINQINLSFEQTEQDKSKLSNEIYDLEGMTGRKTRQFYNNLLNTHLPLNYLEIGVWRGSSFISSMYKNNNVSGIAIDNFDVNYSGPNQGSQNKELFIENVNKFLINGETHELRLHEFYQIDVNKLPKTDVYLYDGDHIEHFQYNAFKKMYTCFSDICVVIIDDYNAKDVQKGTQRAKKEFGVDIPFKLVYEKEITYTNDGSHTPIDIAKKEFWNGIYVCVLEKIHEI